ncbi:MAG: hypothetical protein GC179_18370 [Anaerolineaceae bacterium]|nr:hypothetical protein [Anaerolineaceae bacterium]
MTDTTENTNNHSILKWVRRIWFILIVILSFSFLVSIPAAYNMLTTICDATNTECANWAQQTTLEVLAKYHISLAGLAIFNLVVFLVFSVFCWFAGLLVLRYRSHDWHGLLVSYLLITLAAGGPSFFFIISLESANLPPLVELVPGLVILPMYLALSLFFLTFPDGQIYPKWALAGIPIILANYAVWLLPDPVNIEGWPQTTTSLWLLFVFGFHIGIQGYRYRYNYTSEQRQQTKWLLYGAAIALVSVIVLSIFLNNEIGTILEGVLTTVGFYLPIAVGVTIAILFYGLWDIDIIINRTLVYAVLTTVLVGVYALVVGTLSHFIQVQGNFAISLFGAGVVAVLFQPLRHIVQRAINRWIFGQRDEPLKVMIELGKSLEIILSPEAALHHLVETTARTLKLPYVAIEASEDSELISFGTSPMKPERFPLIYHAQAIGMLLVAPRSTKEILNAADQLVLENIARQASNLVYASRLTKDLQKSRQQILTTREEERRRLRRDLHDGLGPALATLTLQAEAAREWLSINPDKSADLLEEIINGTQTTLADIRRIVYALRPPALDDLGLVSAIREQATQYSNNDLIITVEAPEALPPLPAAVEVAAYRIIQEALTNVTRHSKAQLCTVCLDVEGAMDIKISDNGIGIPSKRHAGIGLNSIHERAAELGGSCLITSQPGAGTQVVVSLPKG